MLQFRENFYQTFLSYQDNICTLHVDTQFKLYDNGWNSDPTVKYKFKSYQLWLWQLTRGSMFHYVLFFLKVLLLIYIWLKFRYHPNIYWLHGLAGNDFLKAIFFAGAIDYSDWIYFWSRIWLKWIQKLISPKSIRFWIVFTVFFEWLGCN